MIIGVFGGKRPKFVHPVSPAPRTAVLSRLFRPSRRVVCFNPDDMDEVRKWHPESVAGYLEQVETAWVEPTHSLVVFTSRDLPLSETDRERLWRRFQIPVFEQMITPDGELIAFECEGHEGLHLACSLDDVPAGTVRHGRCRCGEEVTRLFPFELPDDQCTFTVTRSESRRPAASVASMR